MGRRALAAVPVDMNRGELGEGILVSLFRRRLMRQVFGNQRDMGCRPIQNFRERPAEQHRQPNEEPKFWIVGQFPDSASLSASSQSLRSSAIRSSGRSPTCFAFLKTGRPSSKQLAKLSSK